MRKADNFQIFQVLILKEIILEEPVPPGIAAYFLNNKELKKDRNAIAEQ